MSFIARFVRTDGQPHEDYLYNTAEEASAHLDAFAGDDSGLYRHIALFDDEKSNVERILVFQDGKLREDFRDGDIVRINSEFRQRGEERLLFVVKNIHEDTGHCLIVCLNSGMALAPSEMVELRMLDRVAGIEHDMDLDEER